MADRQRPDGTAGAVLAVDVGATTIKMRRFALDGTALEPRSRRTTPHPCPPERLVELIARKAASSPTTRIGLGFPGTVEDGRVLDGANLTRPTGPADEVDAQLDRAWRGFDLASAVAVASGASVVVENDAAMAALGCATGEGVELVLTLGTGFGMSLVCDGRLVRVRDLGDETLLGSATYDDVLGERGRRRDEAQWLRYVIATIGELAREFSATQVHLAGGNARRLSPHSFGEFGPRITIERDDPALLGAFRAAMA